MKRIKQYTRTTLITLLFIFASFPSFADSPFSKVNADIHQQSALSSSSGKININTASAASLAALLKGIGLKRAKSIVDYRNRFGPFKNIQAITKVSGIGDKTLERNAALISVN